MALYVQGRGRCAALHSGAEKVAAAGAPDWAKRLLAEPTTEEGDPLAPADWSEAWDWAASSRHLQSIDERERLAELTKERVELDAGIRQNLTSASSASARSTRWPAP